MVIAKKKKCYVCGIEYEGEICPNCSIQCRHCNHLWNYKGSLVKVTCPSCQLKTPNKMPDKNVEVFQK